MAVTAGSTATRPRPGIGPLVAVLLAGFVIRIPLISVSPLIPTIEAHLGIGSLQAGVLTALPVLCMGVFAPLAPALRRVVGLDRTIGWALVAETAGVAARGAGSHLAVLYAATLLAGAGAGVLNAALPATLLERPLARAETSTAAYGAVLNLGAAVVAATTVPLQWALHSWTAALALWAPLCAAAGLVWMKWRPPAPAEVHQRTTTGLGGVSQRRWRVVLAVTYMVLQAIVFYGVLGWLAPSYEARGMSGVEAGGLLALLSAVEVAAMLIPALAGRTSRRPALLGSAVSCLLGLCGLLFAPDAAPWAVAVLLGVGVGAMFPLGLLLIGDSVVTASQTTAVAALAFLCSYLAAAASPVALGGLHQMSGAYAPGWALLVMCNVGLVAVSARWPRRARTLATGDPPSQE